MYEEMYGRVAVNATRQYAMQLNAASCSAYTYKSSIAIGDATTFQVKFPQVTNKAQLESKCNLIHAQ